MLKAAGIQIHGTPDKEKNLEKARRLARIAAERGARLICFPELFATPWFPADIRAENFSLAEEIPGPTTETMQGPIGFSGWQTILKRGHSRGVLIPWRTPPQRHSGCCLEGSTSM